MRELTFHYNVCYPHNSACVLDEDYTTIYAWMAVASRGCRGFQLWTNYAMCTPTEQLPRTRRHMPTMFRRALSIPLNTSLATPCGITRVREGWTMRPPLTFSGKWSRRAAGTFPAGIPPVSSCIRKPFIKISLTKASDCTLRFRRFRWLSVNRASNAFAFRRISRLGFPHR